MHLVDPAPIIAIVKQITHYQKYLFVPQVFTLEITVRADQMKQMDDHPIGPKTETADNSISNQNMMIEKMDKLKKRMNQESE